ncbi:tail fiber domain-containing protein [Kosakonia radicincitans]|uniref:tail fiber domain-containing protein n=1 Tax=Kosakonia radicincitans TaxID=283686 RepID=UPI001FD4B8BB|nr:tail fiber domain-containing protein [Kosakonia radicincitans]
MADIFSGNNLKLLYNTNTGNASPQGVGNTAINEIAAFPVLTISSSRTATETYDSEYTSSLLGEFDVEPIDIVVNYIPDDSTHMLLDSYATSGEEFQITLLYRQEEIQSYAILNGVISSASVSGDVNSVVTKIYQFETSEVVARVSDSVTLIPLYQGDYGVGSNGVDVPEITSSTIAGNSFIKVPASQTDNPLGADMLGIGLVDNANTCKLAISETGSLAIFAKNASSAWSRILTATQIASQYVPNTTTVNGHALAGNVTVTKADVGLSTVTNDPQLKITSNLSDIANVQIARDNLSLYSKGEVDSAIASLTTHVDDADASLQADIDKRALKATTINGYSLASNITLAKADVGLSTVTDDPQLKIADNLSDLNDVAAARTNLDVYSTDEVNNIEGTLQVDINSRALKTTTINGHTLENNITLNKGDIGLSAVTNDSQLKIASNLSDLNNVITARANLDVYSIDQVNNIESTLQADIETRALKATTINGYSLDNNIILSKGDVGLSSVTNDSQLKIASNLSDLNNVAAARTNLGLSTMATQDANNVSITDGTASLTSLTLTTALSITSGGTGAVTAAAARTNLGLGTAATYNTTAGVNNNVMLQGYYGFGVISPSSGQYGSDGGANCFYGVDGSGFGPQAGSGIVCGYDPTRRQQIFTGTSGNLFVRNIAANSYNVSSSTVAWTQMQAVGTSDINFKNVLDDLDVNESLDNINAMEFKKFTYKDDETAAERRGVIAQQIETIDPQYVHSAEGVGKMTLDLNPLLMDALAAIKCLSNLITEQQSQIDELKALTNK